MDGAKMERGCESVDWIYLESVETEAG